MANPAWYQTGTTTSTTIAMTNVAGNCLLVFAGMNGSATLTMSDSQGNVYQKMNGAPTVAAIGHWWVALNIKGGANTITFGSTVNAAAACEYSGIATVRAVESITISGQYPDSTPITLTCGNVSTLNANDMIVVAYTDVTYHPTYTAGTNYTLRAGSGYLQLAVQDYSPSAAGSYATSMSFTGAYKPDYYGVASLGVTIVLSGTPIPVCCSNKTWVYHASASGLSSVSAPAISTTTGKCMLVGVALVFQDPAAIITSVVDTTGTNTYTTVPGSYKYFSTGVKGGVQFFVCPNATGNANNAVKVNLSYSGNVTTNITVWEIQGADTASPVDAAAIGAGGAYGPAITASLAAQANDFIAVVMTNAYGYAVLAPDSGFILDFVNSGAGYGAPDGSAWGGEESNTGVAAGSYTPKFTLSGSNAAYAQWAIAAVAIKQLVVFTGIPNSLMMLGCGT